MYAFVERRTIYEKKKKLSLKQRNVNATEETS